jgi:hypothetical protein
MLSAVQGVRPVSLVERVSHARSVWEYPLRTRGRRGVEAAEAEANPAERALSDELMQADGGVRAHEAAHLAAAGGAAVEGATFDYMVGPDGRRYAVGGSVRVNIAPVPGDPEATIRRAKALINSAYAVGQPSSADLRVAAEAYEMEMTAQRELERDRERGRGDGTGRELAIA